MLREVIKAATSKYILNLPDEYLNREIEILVVPSDEIRAAGSNPDVIRKSAGILAGKIKNPVHWQQAIRAEWDDR